MSAENPSSSLRDISAEAPNANELADLDRQTGDLRADIFNKLPVQDYRYGRCWAVYEAPDNINFGAPDDVLILADSTLREKAAQPPMLRILLQQTNREGGMGYFVTDMTIFSDNDARFFFDVAEIIAGTDDIRPTYAPIFQVDEASHLVLINYMSATPDFGMVDVSGPIPVPVNPFGQAANYEDRAYVVQRARQIIDRLVGVEPVACGPRPE